MSRISRFAGSILALALSSAPMAVAAGGKPHVEGDRLEFTLQDLEGRTVHAADPEFARRVLFITLWGTWCPPCISEIPTLIDLQARLGERGLTIVAIAFEDEQEPVEARRDRLRSFVEEHGINYLVLDGYDATQGDDALPGLRNVQGLPVEILIGRDGKVVAARNGYGAKKKWVRQIERELTELLDAPGLLPDLRKLVQDAIDLGPAFGQRAFEAGSRARRFAGGAGRFEARRRARRVRRSHRLPSVPRW